ncbi:MAG: hypothetical protein E7345_05160 [Clostridiales bacterium]|nr:hypothetical protein [Clostridiales bacterium]
MGLISAIKDLFNKNIECGGEIGDHIIFYSKKDKYLYINKNIIVRDNFNCVVVYKNKVCDVLIAGKYKINAENLPELFSRQKLNDNQKIKKIPVKLFFINTNETNNFQFVANKYFKIKSYEMGNVKGRANGICGFRVIDSASMIRCLLTNNTINNDKINKFLSLLIGDTIDKKISKSKIGINTLLFDGQSIEKMLNTELQDTFDKKGFYIKNIKIKSVDFKKKHREKINEIVAKKKRVIPNLSNIASVNNSVKNEVPIEVSSQGTMQNSQNRININTFVLCRSCGCRNNITSKTCSNCGKKIY